VRILALMKALQFHEYGDRSVMRLEDVAEPAAPRAGEVRVRVHASSINPIDGKIRRGELKLIAGGHFPKRPGLDFSGVVEALGDGVGAYQVGDSVFGAARGMSDGAMVEVINVPASGIARKPRTLDHATAAGVPTVAIGALQSLRDLAKVAKGDAILINGCTGGVGLFALQLAKRMGAIVTGVCSTDGVALASSLGADEVIDFKTQSALAIGKRFRAILELSGKLPFDEAHALLDDHGRYVDFSPSPAALIGNTLANPFRSHKHLFAMTAATQADLASLAASIDGGELRAAPTTVFSIEKYADAYARAESGGVTGKIVLALRGEAGADAGGGA
jgi:NADPH:quinone reductase-like Zn-dependent oxidoreductase